MHPFNKLMQKKKQEGGKQMSPNEKQAKMNVIRDMRKMASDEMSEPLKHLKKVTVASDSPEGVKMGLKKAEQIVSGKDELAHGGMVEEGSEEEMGMDGEPQEAPDEQGSEMHPGESLMSSEGSHIEDASEDDMTPEEIDARIEELTKMKSKMQHGGGFPR